MSYLQLNLNVFRFRCWLIHKTKTTFQESLQGEVPDGAISFDIVEDVKIKCCYVRYGEYSEEAGRSLQISVATNLKETAYNEKILREHHDATGV